MAPTIAPIHELTILICFRGVYTPAYNAILPPPRTAAVVFTFSFKIYTPETPVMSANASACPLDILPIGKGLIAVLDIRESFTTSYTWFSAFADEDASIVPKHVHPNPFQSTDSVLAATYPAAAVATTNPLNRAFDNCL
jgi:hypothetical protein